MNNRYACGRGMRRASETALAALAATAGVTLFAVGAAAQEPAGVIAENLEEVTATITNIDPESRMVSLETEDGRELTVEAGAEVRNFEQIEVGDRVEVQFYEAFAANLTEAPASADDEPVIVAAARAPAGERPAGATGLSYTAVVTIDDIDQETSTVNFTGPGGQPRQVTVEQPEMREFVSQLEPGDRVELTYGEALAVAVMPAEG